MARQFAVSRVSSSTSREARGTSWIAQVSSCLYSKLRLEGCAFPGRIDFLRVLNMSRLNEIEHTADRAFRVGGKDLRELFIHAADALLRLQGQPVTKSSELIREVEIEGFDRETLLVNWLNEILYLQETGHESYMRADVLEISDQHLKAKLYGQKSRRSKRLIKAVTFHGLHVQQAKRLLLSAGVFAYRQDNRSESKPAIQELFCPRTKRRWTGFGGAGQRTCSTARFEAAPTPR